MSTSAAKARERDVGNLVIAGALVVLVIVLVALDATKFVQSSLAGLAIGAILALVCLGFVVVYRATGLLNFAQVGLVTFGAFMTYHGVESWSLPWWLAVVVAAVVCGAIGYAFQRLVLQYMVGAPLFSKILATIGLFLGLQAIVSWWWGTASTGAPIDSPFGANTISVGPTSVFVVNVAAFVIALVVMAVFFLVFEYTRVGLAMRATAIDPEAALAQGMNVHRVVAVSWAIAGVTAAVAGAMLGSNAAPGVGLNSAMIAIVALGAFPAMVLGGLDSPLGAVVGGLVIGLLQSYALTYVPVETVGQFASVMPYFVMILILLVKPFGLFGTADVRRI